MLILFPHNLSILIIGNGTVNGYEHYSSALTDRIIFPAAFVIADSTAPVAGIAASTATASAAPTAASTAYVSSFLLHQHNNINNGYCVAKRHSSISEIVHNVPYSVSGLT
jgi:hypothetical protein